MHPVELQGILKWEYGFVSDTGRSCPCSRWWRSKYSGWNSEPTGVYLRLWLSSSHWLSVSSVYYLGTKSIWSEFAGVEKQKEISAYPTDCPSHHVCLG